MWPLLRPGGGRCHYAGMASIAHDRAGIRQVRVRQAKKKRGSATAKHRGTGSQPNARVSRKKELAVADSAMTLPAPDAQWKLVPFADETVPDSELPAAKDRAVRAMFDWGVLVEASRESGLGRYVLTRHMKSDEVFRLRMQGAKRNCMERVEREMIRRGMIPRGELAAIYVTKHNIPKYREIQRVELTGRGGAPVAYIDAKAELLRRLEAIALKGKGQDDTAIAVGDRPRLMKGGSDGKAEVHTIKKAKGQGYGARSRK